MSSRRPDGSYGSEDLAREPALDADSRPIRTTSHTRDLGIGNTSTSAKPRVSNAAPENSERDLAFEIEASSACLHLAATVTVDMPADHVVRIFLDALNQLFGDIRFDVYLFDGLESERPKPEPEAPAGHAADTQTFELNLSEGPDALGKLTLRAPRDRGFTHRERVVLEKLALQLGTAIQNNRAYRSALYRRNQYAKLIEQANAPILVIGRQREVRTVNEAFCDLTGQRREEVLGGDFIELFPESQRLRLLPLFVNALRGEPTTNLEVKFPTSSGGTVTIALNTAAVLTPSGEVESIVAIGRDVTQVHELEERIIQAEKLATLGQLAAGVVHELNNPLTSISVYSEYLLKKFEQTPDGDPKDVEKLRRVVESADRILRFTRDLVAYARPSSGEPDFVSINEVLDQAIVFCEHVITSCEVRLSKKYAHGLADVYGIKGQLHQVFINLITNACHAMDSGGVLTIETQPEKDAKVMIRVTDSGEGISPENTHRIFEPFFSTKGEGKGTGLGLSIVRNIVEQHGGSIDVRSEVRIGTTFEVVLVCRPDPRG